MLPWLAGSFGADVVALGLALALGSASWAPVLVGTIWIASSVGLSRLVARLMGRPWRLSGPKLSSWPAAIAMAMWTEAFWILSPNSWLPAVEVAAGLSWITIGFALVATVFAIRSRTRRADRHGGG